MDETNFTKPIPEITPETSLKDVVVEKMDRPLKRKVSFDEVINFFSSNIHLPTPHEREKLRLLYEDLKGGDLIIKAMEIAVENRVRTFRYIESILYNWMDLNLHTLSEVEEYMQNYKVSTSGVIKERKDDNHGTKKYSNWGDRQHSSYNKKTQGEVQGKYAGFRPEEADLPGFTEEDFAEFL